jgi:hypothetical protein
VIIIKRKYEKEKEMNLSNEKYQCDLVGNCNDDGEEKSEENTILRGKAEEGAKEAAAT